MKEFLTKYYIQIIIGALLLIGGVWFFKRKSNNSTGAEGLARCLKKNGAKFYAASWCGNCKAQMRMFGDAAKHLPYIECYSGTGQTKECMDAKITGYPTWIFSDGKRQTGALSMQQLKEYAGC